MASRHFNYQGFPLQPDVRISLFHKLMRGRTGVFVFIGISVVLTILPALMYSWPLLIFMVTGAVSRDGCRRFVAWGFGVWLHMESFFLDKILGTHVRIFGHSKEFSDRSLILMNHRCHFDWMFFFPVICKHGDPKKFLVTLKYAGKVFPILGWAMQLRNFLFLTRKWSRDKNELKWKLNYLKATDSKYQLLIFPEGTNLDKRTCDISDKFAQENGYPIFDFVLHPKTTGFKYILKTLRKYKIDSVYDLTVGYPDIFATTEKELISEGRIPHEIHYHIQRYCVSSLPETDDELDEWIRQRWAEKEERLRLFYTHRRFYELSSDRVVNSHPNGSTTKFHASSFPSPEIKSEITTCSVMNAVVFCIVNLIVIGYLCWTLWYVAVLAVSMLLGSIYVSIRTSGADYMIMKGLNNQDFNRTVTNSEEDF